MTEADLFDFHLPAFCVALLFAGAAAMAGLYPHYRCRLKLRDALPTTLLALIFFLMAPAVSLYFGATYSLNRSVAAVLERERTDGGRDPGRTLGTVPGLHVKDPFSTETSAPRFAPSVLKPLRPTAKMYRAKALATLLLWVLVVVGLDGSAVLVVHLICRWRRIG
jgi:hypothetical protein